MLPWVRWAELGVVFLLGLLLWLLNHPYQGVWHDAQIYALLAAHWLNPQALAGDLFFRFGSQGSATLFTPVFGEWVGALGLSRASWWAVLGGGLLWVGACLALARTLLGTGFAARFALVLGAVVVMSYSPNRSTFMLGENFATARLWAIPLALASVAALAAKRSGWSLGFGVAAVLLHPLHGIWALALWVLTRARTPVAWCLALLPIVVVLLFGLADLNLAHVRLISGDWLAGSLGPKSDVVFQAAQNRLSLYLGVVLALSLAARQGSAQWRGLYLRLALVCSSGLGLTLIVSFLFPVELVVQAQPWRVLALTLPLAALALIDLARLAWGSSMAGRLLVVLVGILASIGSDGLLAALCGIGLASLAPREWLGRIEAWMDGRIRWFGASVLLLGLALVPNILANWEMLGGQSLNPWWTGAEWLHGLVAGANWHLAAVLALLPWWPGGGDGQAGKESRQWPPAILSAVLLGLGLVTTLVIHDWDRRLEPIRIAQQCYLDASCPPHPFRQWIAPGSTVFWPGQELTVWFELGTASYVGDVQSTGKVFSAEKYFEWQRRQAWVASAADPRGLCDDPILDWLVLPRSLPGLPAQAVARGANLYSCADLRAVRPASTVPQAVQ